jgi:hypothetical protein
MIWVDLQDYEERKQSYKSINLSKSWFRQLLSSELNVQVCDATKLNRITKAG